MGLAEEVLLGAQNSAPTGTQVSPIGTLLVAMLFSVELCVGEIGLVSVIIFIVDFEGFEGLRVDFVGCTKSSEGPLVAKLSKISLGRPILKGLLKYLSPSHHCKLEEIELDFWL